MSQRRVGGRCSGDTSGAKHPGIGFSNGKAARTPHDGRIDSELNMVLNQDCTCLLTLSAQHAYSNHRLPLQGDLALCVGVFLARRGRP